MVSNDDDFAGDAVETAVRAANRAKTAKKKAEQATTNAKKKAEKAATEALAATRKEIKRKAKIIDLRKTEFAKKTMRSYFQSSRGGASQPLAMVFDGTLLEVPGAEANSFEEYPNEDSSNQRRSAGRASSTRNMIFCHGSSSGAGDTSVVTSKSPAITISLESDNGVDVKLAEVVDDCEASEDDSDFEAPPKRSRAAGQSKLESSRSEAQRRYDRHWKFQTILAAELPWAEGIMDADGILHMVKCKVCNVVDRKPCIMAPKSDTLFKHDGQRIAKKDMPQFNVKLGEHYIATQCKHRKKLCLYSVHPPPIVLQQIHLCTSMEARKKKVQFATLFQLLNEGRPMIEYESRIHLYRLLNVPDLPVAHWCDNSGWTMAAYMYKQVCSEMKKLIDAARYFAVTVDEVTSGDNGNFLSSCLYGSRLGLNSFPCFFTACGMQP